MDGWHIALYAFAVYLAVRTLVALMKSYEKGLRRKAGQKALSLPKPAADAAESRSAG